MPETSVREMIRDYQKEVRGENLVPARAAEILKDLSTLIGNCNDEIRRRLVIYNKVKREAYETELKANRARILAETDPSYESWLEAKDTKELCVEMIRSLKYYLNNLKEEWQYAGH